MTDQQLLQVLTASVKASKIQIREQINIIKNEIASQEQVISQDQITFMKKQLVGLQQRLRNINELLHEENSDPNEAQIEENLFQYLYKQRLIWTRYSNPDSEALKNSQIKELCIDEMFGEKYQSNLKHVSKWKDNQLMVNEEQKEIKGNLIISASSLSFLNDSIQNQQKRIEQFDEQNAQETKINTTQNNQEHKYMFFYLFVPENIQMRSVLVFGEFAKTYKVSKDQLATCKQISQDLKYHNIVVNNIIHDMDVVYKQYMQYQVEVVYANLQNDASPYELCIDKQNIKQKYIENKLIEIDFEEVGDTVDCSQMIKHQRNRLNCGKALTISNKLDGDYIKFQDIGKILNFLSKRVFEASPFVAQSSKMGHQLFQKKSVTTLLQWANNQDNSSNDKLNNIKISLFWLINYPLVMISTQCSGKAYQQMLIFTLYVVLKLYSDILLFNPIDLEEPEKKIYKTKSKTKDSCQPVEKEVKQFALHSSNKEGAQVLTAFSKSFLAQYISFLTKLLSQCTNNHLFRANSYSLQDYNNLIQMLKQYTTCNVACESQTQKLEENMLFLHLADKENIQLPKNEKSDYLKVSLQLNIEKQLDQKEIQDIKQLGEAVAEILKGNNTSYEQVFSQVLIFWNEIDSSIINDTFDKQVYKKFETALLKIQHNENELNGQSQNNIIHTELNELFNVQYVHQTQKQGMIQYQQNIDQLVTIQDIQKDYNQMYKREIQFNEIIHYLQYNNFSVKEKILKRMDNKQNMIIGVIADLYYKVEK
ncbi:Conserved_hypothetical protein [Hexamita inflata]|uniref:Uncharacterized protein n=1 Tax=Hexamita inflata TaxID=28002 RepID=A0AA86NBG4_9EUKA|nr:Conserved hypothetical protein [Hexamita inflata]